MNTRSEADWLALCLASESNLPHEWPLIGWVIRNRVHSSRFPNTYQSVILQPSQFSYFNSFKGSSEEIFSKALSGYAGKIFSGRDAISCALAIISAASWQAPFGPDVLHYWSPISMVPKGSLPSWAKQAKRTFTLSGIDPERFACAEGVP